MCDAYCQEQNIPHTYLGGKMDTIGKRINYIRKSKNRTQVQFAKELGISQTHVSKLEKDIENPSDMLLLFISQKYNFNIDWLKNGTGEPEKKGGSDFEGQIVHFKNLADSFEQQLYSMSIDEVWNSVDSMNYLLQIIKNLSSLNNNLESICALKSICNIMQKLSSISYKKNSNEVKNSFENKVLNDKLANEINDSILELLKI